METVAEIWRGDLFDRKSEAEDIIGYLEHVVRRPAIREDGHAHVLAVDSSYGHGKTFFLRRLDRHLRATEHVSAFVDAWVDDLEDQPIVALAATLDRALEPWVEKVPKLKAALDAFKARAGDVTKIVGIGVAKRVFGFAITEGAVNLLGDLLAKADGVKQGVRTENVQTIGKDLVDEASSSTPETARSNMDERIEQFQRGRVAIRDMKDSLEAVVQALSDAKMKLPICIIVDELDRCRPTYAIKVLEEIKHLFDVNGVAFVLGMHGEQLAHSVQAAYGASFDGNSYLSRFFNKRYKLRDKGLEPLLQTLFDKLGVGENLIRFPRCVAIRASARSGQLSNASIIADYMGIFNLTARDAFAVAEAFQVACALSEAPLLGALITPMILWKISSKPVNAFLEDNNFSWMFVVENLDDQNENVSPAQYYLRLQAAANMTDHQISLAARRDELTAEMQTVYSLGEGLSKESYGRPSKYENLLSAVSRFIPEPPTA